VIIKSLDLFEYTTILKLIVLAVSLS